MMNASWKLTRRFSEVDLALFAAATRNPHLIHLNPDFARASGLPDIVVQSHFIPAALLASIDERMGVTEGTLLTNIEWRNRSPILPNQDVVLSIHPDSEETAFTWDARVGETIGATGTIALGREGG